MMKSGYRLALLRNECGGGQIVNTFDSNRAVLDLVLVGVILLWLSAARHHQAASIRIDNSTKKQSTIFIL